MVFPKREGWFTEFYEEMQSWIPAGFRAWPPHEERATALRTWTPGFIDGLFQTRAYARAHLLTATVVPERVTRSLTGTLRPPSRTGMRAGG